MRRLTTLAALLIAHALAGCGSESRLEVAPVRGKVTYKGAPLTKGSLTFQPASGPLAHGEIQPDGTYQLTTYGADDGAVLGEHKISIVAQDGTPGSMPGTPGYVPPKALVPAKFNDPTTSGLTATVTKEDKPIDFTLN